MKMYNIFRHASPLTEAEDMFPGISSSALDEITPKDQRPVPGEDLKSLEDLSIELSNLRQAPVSYYEHLEKHLEDNDAFNSILYSTAKTGDVPYSSFDWLPKYEHVKNLLDSYTINKSSRLFKTIESNIRSLNSLQKRIKFFDNKKRVVQGKINKIRNKETNVLKKKKKALVGVSAKTFDVFIKSSPQIPAPSPIPNKVSTSTGRSVANPYVHAGAAKQYAGHVAHYPHWSDYWKDQIVRIEEMLKRNGKGGLEMMYASTHQNGGGRFNFIITGANGKLTWRKYDPSPGAGQNWIILAGNKINTSSLLGATPAKQDTLVAPL